MPLWQKKLVKCDFDKQTETLTAMLIGYDGEVIEQLQVK